VDETQQQSDADAKPKGSQHEKSPDVETDRPHYQEGTREKKPSKTYRLSDDKRHPSASWICDECWERAKPN
jgi:hypothetical protein